MADRKSIAEARRNLPSLIREAEAGRPVEIARHGRPVAILIGRREYAALLAGASGFRSAYERFSARYDRTELAFDPDALFSDAAAPRAPERDDR